MNKTHEDCFKREGMPPACPTKATPSHTKKILIFSYQAIAKGVIPGLYLLN